MTAMTLAWFGAGLLLLVLGAESLVRGASRLAAAVGIPPLVIGLTVVAYGTSSPELAVSLKGAWSGQGDLAVGNVVGSNIFNVLFILGISALITPLAVAQQIVRLDVPLMIGVCCLTLAMAWDGRITRSEGLLLFAGFALYTIFLIRMSRTETANVQAEYEQEYGESKIPAGGSVPAQILLAALGLGLLVLGSRWIVDSAIVMARALGISDLIIGLTIVAAGTSMPEVATSVMAAIRGERDIAVGNVIGSNIFNLLAVLGLSSVVGGGLGVAPSLLAFDLPVMLAVALACLPICFTGFAIARWEGAVFTAYYAAYAGYLILAASEHDALPWFSGIMIGFVVPVTALTLIVLSVRGRRRPARWHLGT
jgi:cation:H+ antiporter